MCACVAAAVFAEGIAMNSKHTTEVHIFLSDNDGVNDLRHSRY